MCGAINGFHNLGDKDSLSRINHFDQRKKRKPSGPQAERLRGTHVLEILNTLIVIQDHR